MRREWIYPAALLAGFVPRPHAQATKDVTPATITFYAGGTLAKNAVFTGCIFDGEQMLGCVTHQTFVTVKIAPGQHVFSASLSERHAAKNSQTEMALESGKNYYVRAVTEKDEFKDVIGRIKGRLEIVSCEVAHNETTKAAVMGDDQLGKTYQTKGLPDMPACP